MRTRRPCPAPVARSAFAGFRFPPDVIVLAVRWYLRFSLMPLCEGRGQWRYVYRAIDQFGHAPAEVRH